MKKKFLVNGMFCAACVSHVDKAVNKIKGINKVSVSLLSNCMIVDYDEELVSEVDIINAVKKVGFDACLDDNRIVTDSKVKNRKNGLIISLVLMFILLYIAMGPMVNLPMFTFISENIVLNGIVQIILLIPILVINRNFFIDAYKKIIKGSVNMNTLISLGSIASILYGLYTIIICLIKDYDHSRHLDLYFESAGTIVTLVSLGKYIEYKSKSKTTKAINELLNLVPKKAIRLNLIDGKYIEEEVFVEEIEVNDILLVKNGTAIPVDGIIIEGNSEIDESSLSGESSLVYKKEGDKVLSSTIVTIGSFKMKATSLISSSTISKIIEIVDEASNSKAPISRLADKVSSIFVPAVIVISILSFALWMIFKNDFEFSFKIAISVLVISCPCALGLATPLAIMIATGKGAKLGLLFKDAESIEQLYKSNVICLDKTGTITSGELKLNKFLDLSKSQVDTFKIAASLENLSSHPIAKSIVKEYNVDLYEVNDFKLIVGRGVQGEVIIENIKETYYLGNVSYMQELGLNIDVEIVKEQLESAQTVLLLSNIKEILAIYCISDEIKESSFNAINELKELGKKVIMMTGDNYKVANRVACDLGIEEIYYEILPEEKGSIITKLQEQGNLVTMVGDGINDAIALTKSDIGIAIGAGTDVAISSSNVVLMKNDLKDLVNACKLSKNTIKNIKLSLFFAFFYNILCIPIACGILYPFFEIILNPMIASLAMSLSSISVVLNSIRLTKKI